ncbi:MAG: methyltransferase [Chthonomonas sp.]
MPQIPPGSVPFFITSPPYWNLKDYGGVQGQIGQESYPAYLDRLNQVWEECFRLAATESILVVNVNSRRAAKRFYPIAFDIAAKMKTWELWDVLIWYIPNALPQPNHYMNRLFDDKFEYLLVFKKGHPDKHTFHKPRVPQKYATADPRAHKKNADGRCIGNVIRIPAYRPPNVKALGYHVAAFPEELVAILLETYTNEGDSVLDPFLGSGTTLKVARHMNRLGIGYELNESYRPLIEARIKEAWAVPDWRDLDIIHSTRFETGMEKPRKIHFHRNNGTLFEE